MLFQQLNEKASAQGLQFLVIGGHAVIEHGFQRGTEDADILVPKSDRAKWCEVVQQLGYTIYHDGGTFIQFRSDVADRWDLDLMLTPEDTFTRLVAGAKAASVEGAAVRVPSLEHLLALKIHALKHGRGLRVLKDMTDVAQLLLVNRIEGNSSWLRALFEKHGNLEMYERIKKLLS